MPNPQKEQFVIELTDILKQTHALVLTDYRGLSASQLQDLRKKLYETGGSFQIIKNSLLSRALESAGYAQPEEHILQGPTAVLFSTENIVDTLKTFAEFAKELELPEVKNGYLQKEPITKEKVLYIANLPELPVLHAKLVAQLNSPIYKFHRQLRGQIERLVYTLKNAQEKMKEVTVNE